MYKFWYLWCRLSTNASNDVLRTKHILEFYLAYFTANVYFFLYIYVYSFSVFFLFFLHSVVVCCIWFHLCFASVANKCTYFVRSGGWNRHDAFCTIHIVLTCPTLWAICLSATSISHTESSVATWHSLAKYETISSLARLWGHVITTRVTPWCVIIRISTISNECYDAGQF